jgi:hypothetical protein
MDYAEDDFIILDLIAARHAAGEEVFVFTSGNLRGKLIKLRFLDKAIPAPTYLKVHPKKAEPEPCIAVLLTPRPAVIGDKDPLSVFSTRKTQTYCIPARVAIDAMFLQKLEAGKWMLNINTSIK